MDAATVQAAQRTPEWFKAREGKLTASMFGQAAGLGPGSRQQLWRRFFGVEVFEGNEATDWGEKHEPVALSEYAKATATNPTLAGFIKHPHYDWMGGSPDFLVEQNGMGEIKCPFSQEIYPVIPDYYMAQMQGLMQITGRDWCDFVCWVPTQMSIRRVMRSNAYWDWLHVRLSDFWTWVAAQVEPVREKKQAIPSEVTAQVVVGDERLIRFTTKGK
jgi:putative phage-type endonuclease